MKLTIGKYVPGNSFFHNVDPRVKFAASISIIVILFLVNYFFTSLIILAFIIVAFLISTKNPMALLKILRTPIYIGFFIFILNLVILAPVDFSSSNNLSTNYYFGVKNLVSRSYGKWWFFNLSYVAIITTLNIVIKIYTLILTTLILTYTTKPFMLTQAIEFYLSPLKLIRFRVQILSMIISLALRFIPTLLDEASRIMKAQSSRGVDFKNGNIKAKIQSTITLIIPLFVTAFAKASDLANAMETRGYDPYAKRTKYRRLVLSWKDLVISLILFGFIALVVIDSFNAPMLSKELNDYFLPHFWLITQLRL